MTCHSYIQLQSSARHLFPVTKDLAVGPLTSCSTKSLLLSPPKLLGISVIINISEYQLLYVFAFIFSLFKVERGVSIWLVASYSNVI
jgi:hypothetical protein